jgi:hypothetical protein
MTIAVGILASDGIVIAADRLETLPGYSKSDVGKIRHISHAGRLSKDEPFRHGAFCVTGAGSGGVLDSLSQELIRVFDTNRAIDVKPKMRDLMDGALVNFMGRHVVPFNDPSDAGPHMLLAYQRENNVGLWTTDRSAMTEIHSGAVGLGMHRAYEFLTKMGDAPEMLSLSVQEAAAVAAFAIFDVKNNIDGCGSHTDICYIHDNRVRPVSRQVVSALEDVFRGYVAECETRVLRYVFYEHERTAPKRQLADVRKRIRHLIEAMPK